MQMGKYCKAYHVERFRGYPGWSEDVASLRPEKKIEDGKEVEVPRAALDPRDVLYLQENYVVTDGIFKDEHIVFGNVTEEWKRYCEEVLEFRVPDLASPGAES